MRLQTYFTFALNVAKKNHKTFKQFCSSYMPFSWDKDKNLKEEVLNLTSSDWEAKEQKIKKGVIKKGNIDEIEKGLT